MSTSLNDLVDTVHTICKLFPNVKAAEIQNYFDNVSPSIHHNIRIPLTIQHFYNLSDDNAYCDEENEQHANTIKELFPKYDKTKILSKLRKYGNTHCRLEIIVRSILKKMFKNQKQSWNEINKPVECSLKRKNLDSVTICQPKVIKTDYSPCLPVTHTSTSNIGFKLDSDDLRTLHHCASSSKCEDPRLHTFSVSSDSSDEHPENIFSPATYKSEEIAATSTSRSLQENPIISPCKENFTEYASTSCDLITKEKLSELEKASLSELRKIALADSSDSEEENIICDNSKFEKRLKIHKKDLLIIEDSVQCRPSSSSSNVSTNLILPVYSKPLSSKCDFVTDIPLAPLDENKELSDLLDGIIFEPSWLFANSENETDKIANEAKELNSVALPVFDDKDVDLKMASYLMEMFPVAQPEYLKGFCKKNSDALLNMDHVINKILSEDYPKRHFKVSSSSEAMDINSQYDILRELLPNADPDYLRMKAEGFKCNDEEFKLFIDHAMEFHDYPTVKEYERKQKLSAQMKQYTVDFSVENFVKIFPEPLHTFGNPNRNVITQTDKDSIYYKTCFLRNLFDRLTVKKIQEELMKNNDRLYHTVLQLRKCLQVKTLLMKGKRPKGILPASCSNIPLLQEIAFIEHEAEILEYIENKKKEKEIGRLHAKENGLLVTCGCCFEEEMLPFECFTCVNNCTFCRDCIKKSTEVLFGEGKLDFPCLNRCGAEFSLMTLQAALPPSLFSKIALKKSVAEVKAAGIEELETCPFCDFATIPPEGDKLFRCLNPDCMKESCRACKEPSHVPLRCDEVEKDEEIRKRVYIENKMTEALLRKCWKCGIKFYKEEGCNKMTCSCGAKMCYICSKPVKDYSHFNGIGGDKHHLCPLYSDNNVLNKEAVIEGAKKAKDEMGVSNDSGTLKIDPTSDIEQFYQNRASRLPREPHLNLLQNFFPHAGPQARNQPRIVLQNFHPHPGPQIHARNQPRVGEAIEYFNNIHYQNVRHQNH